jgi:hypothetical protein
MTFKRGLRPEAINSIRRMTDEGRNWWCDLLELWEPSGSGKSGLRLTVRHNTIDFYRDGACAAHVAFGRCKRGECAPIRVQTHLKYLINDETVGQKIATLHLGSHDWLVSSAAESMPISNRPFKEIIRAIDYRSNQIRKARNRQGLEKEGVDAIIANNASIIDIEMALPGFKLDEKNLTAQISSRKKRNTVAPRIDIVTLENNRDVDCIVPYEAKTYDDPRFEVPGAISFQLQKYKSWLTTNKKDVINAYRKSCAILVQLYHIANKREPAEVLLRAAAPESTLDIDLNPRLILFGRTKPKNFDTHLAKLKGVRIVCADDPKEIILA